MMTLLLKDIQLIVSLTLIPLIKVVDGLLTLTLPYRARLNQERLRLVND